MNGGRGSEINFINALTLNTPLRVQRTRCKHTHKHVYSNFWYFFSRFFYVQTLIQKCFMGKCYIPHTCLDGCVCVCMSEFWICAQNMCVDFEFEFWLCDATSSDANTRTHKHILAMSTKLALHKSKQSIASYSFSFLFRFWWF